MAVSGITVGAVASFLKGRGFDPRYMQYFLQGIANMDLKVTGIEGQNFINFYKNFIS